MNYVLSTVKYTYTSVSTTSDGFIGSFLCVDV